MHIQLTLFTYDWHARKFSSCCSSSVSRFNKALNRSETISPKPVFAHLKIRYITKIIINTKKTEKNK